MPPKPKLGRVSLVGAGPGDPGLLTIRGRTLLEQADVIYYDNLAAPAVLGYAPRTVEKIYVGKKRADHAISQQELSNRLVAEANKGRRVVRLKGGDPYIFGRGGEEALAMVNAGIPFRIIPGISAGIGGLAYAGIPVTHRDTNSAVTFVTGHSANGPISESLNWQAIASGAPVLVFYMALKQLPTIARCLIDAGRRGDEAVAIVSRATTPEQIVIESTLSTCCKTADVIKTPAIIVVGPVVRLRSVLDWFDVKHTKSGAVEQTPLFHNDNMLSRD